MEQSPPVRRVLPGVRLEQIPPRADGAFERLDPAVRYLWMLSRLIFLGIISLVGLFGLLVTGGLNWVFSHPLMGAALMLAVGLVFVFYLLWPFAAFRHWGYALRETDLLIRSGVLWKHVIAVPFNRIQHVDSAAGPLMRSMGLARLTIHTAGSQMGSVGLPGLPAARAEALRDYLSKVGHSYANL